MKKNLLNSVKLVSPKTNTFDLTHVVKTSLNMGVLVPVLLLECIPGDLFRISTECLIRFQPLVSPVMHWFDVFVHYYFVPNRIVWANFTKFIAPETDDAVMPAFPYVIHGAGTQVPGTLGNYQFLPITATNDIDASAIPHAGYQCIYNEYYRDQNLVNAVNYQLVDGNNGANYLELTTLRVRAWEHDYLTSCLPFAQKGQPVELPIGSQADMPVKYDANTGVPGTFVDWVGETVSPGDTNITAEHGQSTVTSFGELYAEGGQPIGATTINDLRTAEALQKWLEKMARGGTRYTEVIRANFDVISSDARLQRPEYITGMKAPIVVSEVLNTAGQNTLDPSEPGLPQGNMAGHAFAAMGGNTGKFFCEEHGYIHGILSVMPRTSYQQGLDRHWSRRSREEFYWPDFAHLGEQGVLNQEVYMDAANPEDVFGYIPRYAEMRFMNSRVTGQFQTSLDFWHYGRIFTSEPALNQQFIECHTDNRIFAVQDPDENVILGEIMHKVYATRKIPVYGTPSF